MWHGVSDHHRPALVPVQSGRAYHLTSPPPNALVTRELAAELQNVLERFADEAGFNEQNRASFFFRPGVVGHHQVGRAADIYEVGGIGLEVWKQRWDAAIQIAERAANPNERRRLLGQERTRNLGWRLYKALQIYGNWAQPAGYPVQLFGPWTRSEGPLTGISNGLLYAHRDHIHVAK